MRLKMEHAWLETLGINPVSWVRLLTLKKQPTLEQPVGRTNIFSMWEWNPRHAAQQSNVQPLQQPWRQIDFILTKFLCT